MLDLRSLVRGILIFGIEILAVPQAAASTVPDGVVGSVIAANTFSLAYFTTVGDRSAKPPCATTNNWVINIATPQGRAAYATALTAKIAGSKVEIIGAANCSDDPTGETVQLISIK